MATFLKKKCCWLVYSLLFMPAVSLFAQQINYNLTTLITSAEKHLPELLESEALINSARANVTDVRHSFLPKLNVNDQVNIGTDNSIAGSYLPLTVIPSASSGVTDANNYQSATGNIAVLYSQYELENFGLNNARIKNAEAYVDLQQAGLQKQLYFIQIEIAKLYFNLLQNSYRLNVDKQNVQRYDSIFTIINALTVSGIKPGSDSSLAKAELSKTRITYNQTLGNLNNIKQQLAYLTGIDAATININDPVDSFVAIKSSLLNLSPDTVNNPLIDYYTRQKNIYLTDEALIRKSFLPKIVVGASTWARGSSIQYNEDYKALSTGLGYQRFNYSIGVGITYDLFNGIYKKDKLAINRFQTQASDYELQQQKLALASSSLQADNALQTTEANLNELPIQLKAAQDTYRQKLAQYKAGIISLIDLTNASFVLYRSQTDYIETVNDWYLAQLDKAAATGNLNLFIQTIK